MKKRFLGITALSAVILFLAMLTEHGTRIIAKDAQAQSPICTCGGTKFYINGTLPSSTQNISNQIGANCYAWNEFIALNWPVGANQYFGAPGDLGLVQWETYKSIEQIFLPGGRSPVAFRSLGAVPKGADPVKFRSGKYLILDQNQKIPRNFSSNQVVINPGAAWLGAQNGTNIWYEVLVNQNEYDYIVNNHYYNAQAQLDSCKKGVKIMLPSKGDGAIEMKAAWMEVTDTANPKWQRYKLSLAYVEDTAGGKYRETVVALIGLHVLRKTENQPTFVWATFEQVDNEPDPQSGAMPPYNLNNPGCTAQTMTVKTRAGNDTAVTVTCTPNTQPPYYLVHGNKPVPIQVTRLTSLHTSYVDSANAQATRGIVAAYPNSVWQYYRLVNVIWSTSPVQDNQQNTVDSMKLQAIQPNSPVANTTLETYNQLTSCAQTCHKFATIAKVPGVKAPAYLTDFSFVFKNAKVTPTLRKRK